MSQSSDPPKSTTFLLLKATGQTPTITNTSSVAGDAFNRTLRQIASLPQFHSQLFGWRDNAVPSQLVPTAGTDVMKEGELVWDPQYFGWRKPQGSGNETELRVGGDVLVWVINWESAPTLTLTAELIVLLKDIAPHFELPHIAVGDRRVTSSSQVFSVQWDEEGPKRILNRTIRPVELTVSSKCSDGCVQPTQSESVDDENLAPGFLLPQVSPDGEPVASVILRSLSPESSTTSATGEGDMNQQHVLFRASLTRTRWCTKIKEDLMASITSRRAD